jgi:hypothetical protein
MHYTGLVKGYMIDRLYIEGGGCSISVMVKKKRCRLPDNAGSIKNQLLMLRSYCQLWPHPVLFEILHKKAELERRPDALNFEQNRDSFTIHQTQPGI